MRRTYRPGEQHEGDLLDGRIDTLRKYARSHVRELLASRDAKHLDRFWPESGRFGGRELRGAEMGDEDWGED